MSKFEFDARLRIFMAGILMALLAVSCKEESQPTQPGNPVVAATISWQSSGIIWDTTVVKKDKSIVLFLASWCGWCTKLKNETLKDSVVVRILNESFNCIAIDPDADSLVQYRDSTMNCRQFRDQFHVSGYPMAFVRDRRGDSLTTIVGYYPASDYRAFLTHIRDSL